MIYEKDQHQQNNYVSVNTLTQERRNLPNTSGDQQNQLLIQRQESAGNNPNKTMTEAESVSFFTTRLQNEACHILDINRTELNKMEKRYQSDLNLMSGPAGRYIAPPADKEGLSALNQAIQLDINLADTQDRLKGRLEYLRLEIINKKLNLGWIDDPGKDFEKLPVVQQYRDNLIIEKITTRLLEVAGSKRRELRKTFPAMNVLTGLDFDEIKMNKSGIKDVSKMVFEGIERAKKYQDIVRAKVLNGDMPLYKLDILVAKVKQQLKNEGLWKEPFSARVDSWIKAQERFEWVVNIGGTLVGIGLAIGAFFTEGLLAVLLGIAGGTTDVLVAGYNFEMAEDVVGAARSGKGGKEQLVTNESAEVNNIFATINLFLSVINSIIIVNKAAEMVKLVKANRAKLGIEAIEEVLEGSSTTKISEGTVKTAQQLSKESVIDKLERYLLNPDHPKGGSKAEWFEEALGFSKKNINDLADQIVFDPTKAVQTEITEFGIKYNQEILIIGANGKRIEVTFGWIKNNDGVVRLITGIPTKK